MKKVFSTLLLSLVCAMGVQAQEYNLFYDVDADGWLWFDSQEKIDKYVGLCDEENYKVDPNGKPIQLIYADILPDYPPTIADPYWVGVGKDGEFEGEGFRTGALVLSKASSLMSTNGGGFVVCMPSCSSYSICLSSQSSVGCRMLGSRDANAKFTNIREQSSTFKEGFYTALAVHSMFNYLCNPGIYTWAGIESLKSNFDDNPDVLKGNAPVYAYFQNNRNQEVYIHGIRVTTPTNSTVDIKEAVAPKSHIFFEGNQVVLHEAADIKVYNTNGLLMNAAYTDRMDLGNMPKGIYIVKADDAVRKLAVQ